MLVVVLLRSWDGRSHAPPDQHTSRRLHFVDQTLRMQFLWYNVVGCAGVLDVAGLITVLGLEKK